MEFLEDDHTNGISDSLLASYFAGETSPDENILVNKWMAERDENARYMNGLRIIMEHSRLSLTPAHDEQLAWDMLVKKMKRPLKNNTALPLLYKWMGAAAILLVLLATGFMLERNKKPFKIVAAAITELHGDGLRTDTLPDGSIVQLDKNSILYCPLHFGDSARSLQLKGGGYFSVVHDVARPFSITVNDLNITDAGTSFIIKSDNNKTAITVQTGAVEITRKNKSVVLGKGEKISVLNNDTMLLKETAKNFMPVQQQVPQIQVKKRDTASSLLDPKKQKEIIRNIISDIVSTHLVNSKDSIVWFGLTDKEFILNGQKQKTKIQETFTEKYHVKKDNGFYYGPVQMTGNGFFITEKELKE